MLEKLMKSKDLKSFEDIDFMNDKEAFKLLKLKIFKEKSVSSSTTNSSMKDLTNSIELK